MMNSFPIINPGPIASSDDPLARILYWRIARAIERKQLAADHYYAELVDHLHNAA